MLSLRFPNSGIKTKRGKGIADHSQALYKAGTAPTASLQRGDGGAHRGAACGHDTCLPTRCHSRATTPAAGAITRG
ncbi:hypothetical protein BHE74_00047946 [Ensete ventricosum]|nr:hypothetical protein BHE74_00047946 [Ensete ventricosum]